MFRPATFDTLIDPLTGWVTPEPSTRSLVELTERDGIFERSRLNNEIRENVPVSVDAEESEVEPISASIFARLVFAVV